MTYALSVGSTNSDFAIAVQVDGGERVVLDPIPEGGWATIVFPTPVTARGLVQGTSE
jgi:hypothetical protein